MSNDEASRAFDLLDQRIQRYIWLQGWETLREVQEQSIPLIVNCDRDVIVTAATAAGKTEAAFLPALTYLGRQGGEGVIIYVSPLKALINDQFSRLGLLCENLEIPVWPWHGDISASVKERFAKQRRGVVLITPESLESLLCRRVSTLGGALEGLTCFVIDELHAFLGSERGKQLQSLLHRIDRLIGRSVPRIGLSATLGDMRLAAEFMRPGAADQVAIVSTGSAESELRVLVRGYEFQPVLLAASDDPDDVGKDDGGFDAQIGARGSTLSSSGNPEDHGGGDDDEAVDESRSKDDSGAADGRPEVIEELVDEEEPIDDSPPWLISKELFRVLRGSNNLVFPNSRRQVEMYSYTLQRLCEEAQVPNEFWPHHGSLSKSIREETERALKQGERPATAICTSTLELGIDIGAVKCVAQVGPPFSTASLRQRLGRSGRRKGEPSILRGFVTEDALSTSRLPQQQLRLRTVQFAALVELLIERWFEPPRIGGMHLSTLVQQILAYIAQQGGASAGELYQVLCAPGSPFATVGRAEFAQLLRHLGSTEFLMQDGDGSLLHGRVGEQIVNHYSFYAAFKSEEEFRVVCGQRTLGTLPVDQLLRVGQRIMFAGRTWRVEEIDERGKVIYVVRQRGGVPPMFGGGVGRVHRRVRQRMRELLADDRDVAFLDATAKRFLAEGRRAYRDMALAEDPIIAAGTAYAVATWMGDAGNEALCCLMERMGVIAAPAGPFVEIERQSLGGVDIRDLLLDLAASEPPEPAVLLAEARNLARAKWDEALPQALLAANYASEHIDMDEAKVWLSELAAARTAPGVDDSVGISPV